MELRGNRVSESDLCSWSLVMDFVELFGDPTNGEPNSGILPFVSSFGAAGIGELGLWPCELELLPNGFASA